MGNEAAMQSSEGATTGSAVTRIGKAIPGKAKALMGPLDKLTPKHRLIIEYMTHGAPAHIASLVSRSWVDETGESHSRPVQAGVPLTLEEACDCLGIRRRHGRHLFSQQLFKTELTKAIEALRDGAKVAALRKVIDLVHEPGEGKAADRTVQLKAAQAILGEQIGQERNASPVQVNVGVNLQPGIVVRLPASAPTTPLELEATAIEQGE